MFAVLILLIYSLYFLGFWGTVFAAIGLWACAKVFA